MLQDTVSAATAQQSRQQALRQLYIQQLQHCQRAAKARYQHQDVTAAAHHTILDIVAATYGSLQRAALLAQPRQHSIHQLHVH